MLEVKVMQVMVIDMPPTLHPGQAKVKVMLAKAKAPKVVTVIIITITTTTISTPHLTLQR